MPNKPLPFGFNTLVIPAYLAKGNGADDPGFQRWKQDHPSSIAAGTWSHAPQPRRDNPPVPDDGSRRLSAEEVANLASQNLLPVDLSTLSISNYKRVAAEAKAKSRSSPLGGARFNKPDRTPEFDPGTGAIAPSGNPGNRTHIYPVAHTNPAGGVPLVLNDGTLVLESSGQPMLVPPNVDINRNIEHGRQISHSSTDARRFEMLSLFLPGARMDYQRTFGSGSSVPFFADINRSYIAFGNFNYGAVAAAAGFSLEQTEFAAGLANILGGKRDGPFGTNPDTLPYIIQGYQAYRQGLVGRQ